MTLVAFLLFGCAGEVEQPLRFNHALHIELEIACDDCHPTARTSTRSGFPETDDCMLCHEEDETEPPDLRILAEYARTEQPIPWRRVYGLAEDVFYSHRRHVAVAQIECETCHGDIGALTAPPPWPLVEQSMDWCLECHERRGASLDCVHCHR